MKRRLMPPYRERVPSDDDFEFGGISKELVDAGDHRAIEPEKPPRVSVAARDNLHQAIKLMKKLEGVLSEIPDDTKWRSKLRGQWRSVEKKMYNILYPCDDMEQVESDGSCSTSSSFSGEDTSELSSGCSVDRSMSKTLSARCVCGKMLEEDFVSLYNNNKLQTLTVARLHPFLKVHKLCLTGLKEEKIERIVDCIRKEKLMIQKDPDAMSDNEDDVDAESVPLSPSLSPEIVPRLQVLESEEKSERCADPSPIPEEIKVTSDPQPPTPREAGRRGSATVLPSPSLLKTPRNNNSYSPQLRRASQPSLSTRGTPTPRRKGSIIETSVASARRAGSFVGSASRLSAPLHTPRRNSFNGPLSARRVNNGEAQSPPLKKIMTGLSSSVARPNKPRSSTLTTSSGANRNSNGRNVAVP